MSLKSYFFPKKNFLINVLILFFIIFVFTNYLHNSFEKYTEVENIKLSEAFTEEKLFKLKDDHLKLDVSKNLIDNDHYNHILDRECKITGQMYDRHKVRWIRVLVHKEILNFAYEIKKTAPYYAEILFHSFLIFISLFLLRKFFIIEDKYTVLFLLFFTYIFQQHMGEYSYSVLDLFFITAALCASKLKKFLVFLIICSLAVLNRETGFLILLCWLIFNYKDYKKFLVASFFTGFIFLTVNYQIISCLFQPKFYAPLEYQHGQINYVDLFSSNIFSIVKILLNNYIIPFGIGFYLFYKSRFKNSFLLTTFVIYLCVFLIATPVHKIELKLLLLPYLWLFVFFYNKKIIFKTSD